MNNNCYDCVYFDTTGHEGFGGRCKKPGYMFAVFIYKHKSHIGPTRCHNGFKPKDNNEIIDTGEDNE